MWGNAYVISGDKSEESYTFMQPRRYANVRRRDLVMTPAIKKSSEENDGRGLREGLGA